HEIDHAIARKHGGKAIAENLVLACLPCNRHKGSDLTSFDPLTGKLTQLYNPRTQIWTNHFGIDEGSILALTATGRTTVALLKMNDIRRLQLRQALALQGLYPDLPTQP
ncbi:MAG: HNH endonuclease, partial [Elainellaceae cyanobacterium]